MEQYLGYLQTLLFLMDTVRLDDLIGMTKSKHICLTSSDWSLQRDRAGILDLLFRNWCTAFGVLSNPVKKLLFRTSFKNGMASLISGWMQEMLERQSHRTSGTIQCPHQCIPLIEIGISCFSSAMSRAYAICWHQNWISWKIVSCRGNLRPDVRMPNSMRRGNKISSGMTGSAAISCNAIAGWVGLSNCALILSGLLDLHPDSLIVNCKWSRL
jgi:hypothetical protein